MVVPFNDLSRAHDAIKDELEKSILTAVRSNWYIQGEGVKAFEESYAEYTGVKHCVGLSNGLDALHVILVALDLPYGSEVIIPANTFIASALAVSYAGLKPVLADVFEENYLINPDRIEAAITDKTKAIMPVHLTGSCCDMDKIADIARRYNLHVVEDNAQAHGCMYNNRMTGGIGIAAGTSFYPGKNLGALGDAGAVTTNNDELAEKVRYLINYGSIKKYHHHYKGYNARLDELQAYALSCKLMHLDSWNTMRKNIANRFIHEIDNPYIHIPTVPYDCVWHLFMVRVQHGCRDELKEYLESKGIHTQIHYPIPIARQECYYGDYDATLYPVSDKLANELLSLPLFPYMSAIEQEYVIETVSKWKQ